LHTAPGATFAGRRGPGRRFAMPNAATRWTPPQRFLTLVIAFGLALIFVNPPFAVNDEDVHLARIYELASGRLLTRSDSLGEYHMVPSDYVTLGAEYERIWPREHGRVRVKKVWRQLMTPPPPDLARMPGRAGSYAPILYAPHVPALWLATHLGLGSLAQLYVVRLAALAVYVLLCWRAVVCSAQLQWLFIITALTPMAVTQAAAVSGDGVVIGLALVFFALVGKGSCTGSTLTRRELWELGLCLVALTLCKALYVLVAICLPVLRWTGPKAEARRWLFPVVLVVMAAALHAGWAHLNRDMTSPPNMTYSSSLQLAWLAANPFSLPGIAWRTLFRHGDEVFLESFFERNKMSSVARFTASIVSVLYFQLALATAWGASRRSFQEATRRRHATFGGFMLCWLVVFSAIPAAFFVCCTRVGAGEVRVLQGRYFIPILPALLLAISPLGKPVLSRWLRFGEGRKILFAICLAHLVCLFSLIGWHYFSPGVEWPF
jgi:uncharacterized membrane protein